jgi:hypothetical protein
MSLKTRFFLKKKPSSIYDEYSSIALINSAMFNQVHQIDNGF